MRKTSHVSGETRIADSPPEGVGVEPTQRVSYHSEPLTTVLKTDALPLGQPSKPTYPFGLAIVPGTPAIVEAHLLTTMSGPLLQLHVIIALRKNLARPKTSQNLP